MLRSHLVALGSANLDESVEILDKLRDIFDLEELIAELSLTADVDLVLQQTAQLVANATLGDFFQLPGARHRWLQLAGASKALSVFCIQNPIESMAILRTEEITWNFGQALSAAIALNSQSDAQSLSDASNRLRKQYRIELLKIALADLLGEASFETTALRLSDLADATLEAALVVAVREVQPSADCSLSLIAMGKTGGRELNYISDVDVLFVVDDVAEEHLSRVLRESTLLAQMVMHIVSSPQMELPLWQIDANLRPEGKDGALVRTVSSYKNYYERWAETWEYQSLLKARPMAGDRHVGESFVAMVQPFIWRAAERENFVSDVQSMRKRVIENIPAMHTERELKLGVGGLRDIEFAIQLLQLVHGKTDEAIRSSNTLVALDCLTRWGYVGREDAETLRATYIFERQLEHRIQMFEMQRTHLLPESQADLRRLGRLLGFKAEAADGLLKSLHQYRYEARRLHEKLFYKPLLQAVARADSDVVRMSLDAAITRLAALGFQDPEAAIRHIQFLTSGVSRRAIIQRNLLPVVLAWMADTPNPDGGLLRFRNLSESMGETPWYLRLLRDESLVLQRLARLLCVSPFIASMLERTPEAMSVLGSDDQLFPREKSALILEMQQTALRQRDFAAGVEAIRRIRQRELIRIATADVFQVITTEIVLQALSELTDAALESAYQSYLEFHPGPNVEISIIGLGRYGGSEMAYASDADVMIVFEGTGEVESESAYAFDFASTLQRTFATPAVGPTLKIDFDLRPEGKNGPIARTLSSYREYYEKWSLTWESQALLRARCVAGNSILGQDFLNLIAPLRFPEHGLSEIELRDIRTMKARVESERLPRGIDPKFHLKLGPGGLSDIEWLVQFVQLNFAHDFPDLKSTSTITVLEQLTKVIGLSEGDVVDCKRAWLLAATIRNYLYLVDSKDSDVLPSQSLTLKIIAYLLHEENSANILEQWMRLSRRARKIFTQVVYEMPLT